MIRRPLKQQWTHKAAGLALATGFLLACGEDPAPSPTPPSAEESKHSSLVEAVKSITDAEGPPAELPENLLGAEELRSMMTTNLQIRNFVFAWALSPDGIFANKWLGVHTIQHPFDVWVTQEIMFEVKPDFVVEAGTHRGGSAALWATILEQINPEARVITIDIEDGVTDAKDLPIVQRRVDFLVGSSTDPDIVADVARRVSGGVVMVILDSLHTEEHVAAELEAYAPLVSVGSYLIVQDTGVGVVPPKSKYPGGGRAAEAFLKRNDAFELDVSRERLVLTSNGHGFLKRVR